MRNGHSGNRLLCSGLPIAFSRTGGVMMRSLVVNEELQTEMGVAAAPQLVCDAVPTFWVSKIDIHEPIPSLYSDVPGPYKMLYDVTAIDERGRTHRDGQPPSDFTVVYHLYSLE